jgi:hypothetical protein
MEMIKPAYLATITLIGALSLNGGAFAAEPREVTWDDLVPAEAEFDDAFTRLDEDTLFELSMVANVRDRIESGQEVDEKTLASYRERVETLEGDGVDVDGLIAMRDQVAKERVAKTYLANEELDGKPVRIPGYLLPLEFDGDKVSELCRCLYSHSAAAAEPDRARQDQRGIRHRRRPLYAGLGQRFDESRAGSVQPEFCRRRVGHPQRLCARGDIRRTIRVIPAPCHPDTSDRRVSGDAAPVLR